MNTLINFLAKSYWRYPFRFFFAIWLIAFGFLALVFEKRSNEVFLFGQVFTAGLIVLLYSITKGMRYG